MSKELWIAEMDRLCEEMMERTGCSWDVAYARIDGREVDKRVANRIADMADHQRMLAKERF